MSKQATSPHHFPEGILLEIFYRLPAKSLGRCMCVSKAWNFLIKDPFLISNHVSHQSNNLFFVKQSLSCQVQYSLHFDDQQFSKYTQLQHMPFGNHHSIVGSCNGLVCFIDFQFSFDIIFILCNPIIKKSVLLPKPCFCHLPYKISVGFGFDSMGNDYKLLKISKRNVLDKCVLAELYSFKNNSWRILDAPRFDLYSDGDFMVFVNGIVHWIGYERVSDEGSYCRYKFSILGFDMRDDVFKEIILPECLSNLPSRVEIYVIPYDELSSIAVIELGALRNECNIWVMKKYGVVESWTKMFSFGKSPAESMMPRVLGLRNNGDLILQSYDCLRLVSHDPERSEINFTGIQGIRTYVCTYMESLVLLDQVTDDAITETGAKYATNASGSIERAADGFNKFDAGDEAADGKSDVEECRGK